MHRIKKVTLLKWKKWKFIKLLDFIRLTAWKYQEKSYQRDSPPFERFCIDKEDQNIKETWIRQEKVNEIGL